MSSIACLRAFGEVALLAPSHCAMHVGSDTGKKRRAMFGLNKGSDKKKERSHSSHSTTTTSSASIATTNNVGDKKASVKFNGLNETVKMRLFALGSEFLLQRSSSSTTTFSSSLSGVMKKQRCQRRRKFGEEEQAAFSLMALSCGSVFA